MIETRTIHERARQRRQSNHNSLMMAMLGFTMVCSLVSAGWVVWTEFRIRRAMTIFDEGTKEFSKGMEDWAKGVADD